MAGADFARIQAFHLRELPPRIEPMSTTSSIVIDKKKVKNPPMEVVQLGNKTLRQPAKRVTKIDEELRETVRQMLQTMYSQDGIGLAAPQVGINKQLVVIDVEIDKPDIEPLVLINPVIKRLGGENVSDQEGCLSRSEERRVGKEC